MFELEQNSERFHAAESRGQAGACSQRGFPKWLRIAAGGLRLQVQECGLFMSLNGNLAVHSPWGDSGVLEDSKA